MKTAKCHICGCENEIPDGQSSCCALCGADLADAQAETVMREMSKGTYATANMPRAQPICDCNIYLTSKRLILLPIHTQMVGYGIQGAATAAITNKLNEKITKNIKTISLPLTEIKSIKSGKLGLFRKAIVIDTADGETIKFLAPKLGEWEEAITKAVGSLR